MADFTSSVNMSLPIPTVGIAGGPLWATLLNTCLTSLDSHSHVAGSGVLITTAALNINADLPVNSHNLTAARSLNFTAQSAAIALPADVGCLYQVSDDLYYNNGAGTPIRLTQAGSIVGTAGSITGLLAPATASYNAISSTFVWQSGTNIAANMDAASLVMRNQSPNSTYALTLSPPAAMAANTAITLPALPASSLPMIISSSGVITAEQVTLAQLVAAVQASLNPAGAILAYGGASAPTGYLLCNGASYLRSDYPALFAAISTAYGAADGTHFNVPDLRGKFVRGQATFATMAQAGAVVSNVAFFPDHGVNRTGVKVRLSSGTLTGLSTGVTYYAIVIDSDHLAFGSTLANALAGTRVALASVSGNGVLVQYEDPDAATRLQTTVGSNSGATIGSSQDSTLGSHNHGVTDPGHHHTSTTTTSGTVQGGVTNTVSSPSGPTVTGDSVTGISINNTGANETTATNVSANYIIKT